MSGATKLEIIRNETIRGTAEVGEISKKVQESRLKWYGHVLRREEEYVGKRVLMMEEDQSGGDWIPSRPTRLRENCQGGSARPG